MAFIGPGAGALGRGQGRPLGWWHRASPPIFPAARVRHPGARTLSCSHCPGATGCQAGAGQGPRSGPPGSQGESSGPAVDALASGLEPHPGGGDATLAMDVGASGGRKPLPAPAPHPRPGEGRGGEGEASGRAPAGTPGSLLRPVSSQPLGTMTLLLSTSPVFEVEAQGGGRLSKGGQSEVGRPDSNPGPRCVRALAPHCAWSLFCRVLPTLGAQWPPSPCVHCGTGCGQRNKLIRCFLPPPPPPPRSWWTGCSARNGRLSPPPRPEPARGAPVLWTPRAGHRLPLAQGLRVALDCSGGPPTLLPLPWLGQRCRGWSQPCWVIGWWRGQWEEPQSTLQERKLSQGGHPAAQAAGVQLQPGRGVCRPGRVAPSCLPPPPTSGSGLSVQGAKGRAAPVAASQATRGPLSPLSDLTAAWPESRHVRWSHGADLDASLSRSERGMRSWPAPSCKASSCV